MSVYIMGATIVLVCSAILSMAGLGAAFIFVPLFFWLGVPLRESMSVALLLNTVSLAFASVSYIKKGLVDFRMSVPIMLTAVITSPIGAILSKYVNRPVLLWLFVAFLLFAGAMMLFYRPGRGYARAAAGAGVAVRAESITLDAVRSDKAPWYGALIGVAAGFLGGMLGVGGGNFIVPVLNWLGYEPKKAAATTAFVVVFSSFTGFLGHISFGGTDIRFVIVTGATAVAGALAGAWLMEHKVSGGQLKKVIGSLLFVMAGKMIFDLLG